MSKRDQITDSPEADSAPVPIELGDDEIRSIDAAELDDEPALDGSYAPADTTAVDLTLDAGSRAPWIEASRIEVAPEPFSAFEPSPPAESPEPPRTEIAVAPPRLRVALGMFALSFVSATAVHLMLMLQPGSLRELLELIESDPTMLRPALIYSLALMGILVAHDLGHSLTSLGSKVQQSYPYFIPFPAIFGTLGSVVFLRAEPPSRPALLRMAVSGPIVGMVVAVPLAAYGLSQSLPLDLSEVPPGATWLGNSLLFTWLAEAFSPNGVEVQLHPLAFAGWAGMFLTSLHLLPAAQLDGGHIARAIFGRAAVVWSLLTVAALFAYGFYLTLNARYGTYAGAPWLLWGTLIFIGGLGHPKVRDHERPLRALDWGAATVCLVLLVVTFIPVPVQIVPDDPSRAEFLEPNSDAPSAEREERDWSVEEPGRAPETFQL